MTEIKSGRWNMKNVKIKFCPYCKHRLHLIWFEDPDDPQEAGYVCASCGMFLDTELENL